MNHKKLSDSILKKIQQEDIKPTSRWYFVFKNILFWFIFGFAVSLGAVAFSVILFVLAESDMDLLFSLQGSKIQIFFSLLPLFWIVFFFGFFTFALWGLQHTKKGYKWSAVYLILLNAGASIVLGSSLYLLEGGERFERIFAQHTPFYQGVEHRFQNLWNDPDRGRLAGQIVEMRENMIFVLDDFSKETWVVDYTEVQRSPRQLLVVGRKVKIMGTQGEEGVFEAHIIRPFLKQRFPRPDRISPQMRQDFQRRIQHNPRMRETLRRLQQSQNSFTDHEETLRDQRLPRP